MVPQIISRYMRLPVWGLMILMLAVTANAQTLTSISPSAGTQGTSVTLTLTGTGFSPTPGNDTVTITDGTHTATGVATTATVTSLTATVTLPATAGSYTVAVTVAGAGTSNALAFTVSPPPNTPPTLTSVSPGSGTAGASATLTLTGTGFDTAGPTNHVLFNGTDLTVGGVTASSATSLAAAVTLPATAGPYSVTVTSTGGTSNPRAFTVSAPPNTTPTLTSVSSSPTSAIAGGSVTLNVTGTNFTTATGNTLTFSPTGGAAATTFAPVNAPSATALTLGVTLPSAGTYDVTVTNANGGPSNPISFTVNIPSPALTGISPTSGRVGTVGAVLTFSGSGFDAVTPANNVVTFDGTVLSAQTVTVATANSLTVTATLPATAGSYSVSVTVGGNTSNSVPFTVSPNPPTLTSVTSSPTPALANNRVTLTLGGTGFTTDSPNTVTLTPTGGSPVTFGSAPAATGSSLALSGTLPAAGTYTVNVTNVNGTTAGFVFTVASAPAPTLTGVTSAPSSAVGGTGVTLTLQGTGFTTGTANTVTLTGTTGTNANVAAIFGTATSAAGTSLTLSGTLPLPADTYTVTVTNANGTSGTVNFTVNNPAPAITGLSPASGVAQTTVNPVVITGMGFVAGSTPRFVSTDGVTVLSPTSFSVDSATQITVHGLGLPASPGALTVTVSNPDPGAATSNAATFTVNPPPPTLTGVTSIPASAITGTNVTATLTGTGFTTGTPNSVTLTGTTGANAGKVFTLGSAPAASGVSLALSGTLPAADTYTVKLSNANGTTGGVTFIVNPGAPPTLTSVSSTPSSAIAGTSVTLSLQGTGFLNGANAVTFTGTTGTNAGSTFTFGTAGSSDGLNLILSGTLPLPPDTYTVTVSNGNGTTSPGRSFTVNPIPVPTLTGVAASPLAAITGMNSTLTLTGTNFTNTSNNTVTLTPPSGSPITFGSATSAGGTTLILSGTLPASGSYNVAVTNQYGTSGAVAFTVNNPNPVITNLSPTSGSPNASVDPLTITGTGFVAGSTPRFVSTDGVTVLSPTSFSVDSATQITVHGLGLPASPGALTVTVSNPDPGAATSNAATFTVNPPPSLTSVTLTSGTGQAGTGATLSIVGANFTTLTTNKVSFNGVAFGSVTSSDGNSLIVSGTMPSLSGVYTITVSNINGVTTPGLSFTVTNPTPVIINIDPKSGPSGSTVSPALTITGAGFVAGSVPVFIFTPTGSTTGSVITPTGFVVGSTTQITVTGLALPSQPGTLTVTVSNPDPGGSVSNPALFQVSTIAPTLTSVSSSQAATPGVSVTLTLIGTNYLFSTTGTPNTITFTDGAGNATVFGKATATDASGTAISIKGTLPSAPGTYTVTVSNVNGSSNASAFTINNPAPTISVPGLFRQDGITPYTSDVINTTTTLIIKGTGFLPPSTPTSTNVSVPAITFNGASQSGYSVSVDSPTQITLTNLLLPASAGTLFITVSNPTPGGGTSTAAQFNVINTSPTITTVVRAGKDINASVVNEAISLTITGTGFINPGSTPNFSFTPTGTQTNSPITPSVPIVDSSTQITITSLQLPPTPGTVTVTVTNPGVASSKGLTFSVGPQQPALASLNPLSPSSILVGDPNFTTLTISSLAPGTFVSTSVVYFGATTTNLGVPLTATFNSTSILTAAINAATTQKVQNIGQYGVTVHTLSGSTDSASAPVPFNVLPLGPTHPDAKGNPTPVGLATNYFAATFANSHDGFQLFSVPYDYGDQPINTTTGTSVLADLDPNTLLTMYQPHSKLAVWDPGIANYDITGSGTLANALVLGSGYWGRFPDPAVTQSVITGLVQRGKTALDPALKNKLDGAGRFRIALLPGWNMIGDPWESPVGVRLQNVQVMGTTADDLPFVGSLSDASAQGLTSPVFFQYDSPTNKYITDDGTGPDARLLPYVGYWVHAYRACTLLVPQP